MFRVKFHWQKEFSICDTIISIISEYKFLLKSDLLDYEIKTFLFYCVTIILWYIIIRKFILNKW